MSLTEFLCTSLCANYKDITGSGGNGCIPHPNSIEVDALCFGMWFILHMVPLTEFMWSNLSVKQKYIKSSDGSEHNPHPNSIELEVAQKWNSKDRLTRRVTFRNAVHITYDVTYRVFVFPPSCKI